MNRPASILVGGGVAAGLLLWLFGGADAMSAYFAAWLFWIGVPMGALPLVTAMEAADTKPSALLPVLRPMLALLPIGTLAALPMVFGLSGLFGRPGLAGALPAWWTAPVTLGLRDGIILLVLSGLAVLFWLPPKRARRRLAAFSLVLTIGLVTVLGIDVVLAPEPGLGSSLAGLLLISGQIALAATVAALVLAVGTDVRARLTGGTGLLLALLIAFWLFLQFAQFLVSWSANLPDEAAWYLARVAGIGTGLIVFIALACVSSIALLPSALGRFPAAMATMAAMVGLALLSATLLFVLPAFRGRLVVGLNDVLALAGVGGLLVGALLLLSRDQEGRHA